MANNDYAYGKNEYDGKFAYAEKITVDRNNERNAYAQRTAGGKFREADDDGMHLIPCIGNGSKGKENLVAGCRSINRGSYKSMEYSVIKAAEAHPEGKVSMRVDTFYGKERPDVIQVENTLTDNYGNITDRQNASWTNLSKEIKEAQGAESRTEFDNYHESLTKEERALSDEMQEKIDTGEIAINEGLDSGWKYVHFNSEEGKEMRSEHDAFVDRLRVDVDPVIPPRSEIPNNSIGGREREDGPGMGGRDNDYKESPISNADENNMETVTEEQDAPFFNSLLEGVHAEVTIDEEGSTILPDGSRGEYDLDNGISGEDSGMSGP